MNKLHHIPDINLHVCITCHEIMIYLYKMAGRRTPSENMGQVSHISVIATTDWHDWMS